MLRLLILLSLLTLCQLSHSTEFAVSPMLINLEAAGGEVEHFEIAVAGKANGRIRLAAYAMTQEISGHMSFSETDFNPANHRALGWIRFENEHYQIKRSETTIVRGNVRIPRDAKGTHLAAIMIEEDPEQSSSNVAIKVRYAVIVNINIGNAPRRMFASFSDAQILETDGRTIITAVFSNKADFMGLLDSRIQIRDEKRKLVARVPLKTESAWQRGDVMSRVYPGASVKVYAEVPAPLASGTYSLLARNQFNGRTQPVYRNQVAYTSTVREIPFENLKFLNADRLVVKRRSSGLSLTPVVLSNPSLDDVIIELPDAGSNEQAGVTSFEFIPAQVRLRPRMTRKVMLKQHHLSGMAYEGDQFVIAATNNQGVSTAQTLYTSGEQGSSR